PQVFDNLEAGTALGDEEGGDAGAVARLAAGAGQDQVVVGRVDTGVPGLLAVDDPAVAVGAGRRLHVGGVGAVVGFGDAEGQGAPAGGKVLHPLRLLLGGAIADHEQRADVVAHDRRLVLQVVV